jgi:hypothetical protein
MGELGDKMQRFVRMFSASGTFRLRGGRCLVSPPQGSASGDRYLRQELERIRGREGDWELKQTGGRVTPTEPLLQCIHICNISQYVLGKMLLVHTQFWNQEKFLFPADYEPEHLRHKMSRLSFPGGKPQSKCRDSPSSAMVNSSSEDMMSLCLSPRQTRPACSGLVQVSLMIVVVATFKRR